MDEKELVIIGGGPAGITAAIYGVRAGLDLVVLEKAALGGQIILTNEVENWPGHKNIPGFDLAESFHAHALHLGCQFRTATVSSIEPGGDTHHIVLTDEGDIRAKAVIIATGASFRRIGCEGESELTGSGVSYCAVCDGAFFSNEEVAVIGGGNTAIQEAMYLTRFASKVYIIHRRDEFRADRLARDRALKHEKIIPIWDSVVERINGGPLVKGVTIKNVKTGQISELPVSGVFIFVGTTPTLEFLGEHLDRAEGGWIKTDEDMRTSIPGIFAAGDVRATNLRQVVTSAADGARAAMTAYEWLMEQPQ